MNLRYTLRSLRSNPGFLLASGLTMMLGIGANTAVFSLVDAVLLRPLPHARPHELVTVEIDARGLNRTNIGMSVPEMDDLRDRSGVFASISAVRRINANLTGSDRPDRIEALGVHPEYFGMLGANAQLGRVFGDQDHVPGFAEAVILSDGLWRRLFGGDPAILGRKLRLDDDLYVVAGVMPPGFRHPGSIAAAPVELWLTTGFSGMPWPQPRRRARMIPAAIGRLKSGLSITQARAGLEAFAADLRRQYPDAYPPNSGWTVRIAELKQEVTGPLRTTLLVVFGAVTFVLLICCVSIANLVVARAMGRQSEIAVRRALGAPWRSIIAQLLAESLTVSLLGGAAAWIAVKWSEPWLARLVPQTLAVGETGASGSVLAFTLGISVLTGVIFGLAPVFPLRRIAINDCLKAGGRGSGGAAHHRFRSALVASEIAFSMMLMVGCGLLLHSFWKVSRQDPGFRPEKVALANLRLPFPNDASKGKYTRPEPQVTFMREVLRHVRELPGVELAAIGAGASTPLSGFNRSRFRPEGYTAPDEGLNAEVTTVTPDFFRVLGTPLIHGRMLAETDDMKQPDIALIDERMAHLAWPGQDPTGKRFEDYPNHWVTVIGVVGDVKSRALDEPDLPHVYYSAYQQSDLAMTVFARTTGNPAALGDSLRRAVQSVDPDQPVYAVRTLEEVVARSLAQRRFQLQAIGAFAIVALLLAAIGIYGVTAYWVRQRSHEIGIRMALGAQSGDVVRLVLRQGLKVTLTGLAAGLAGAIPLALMVRSLLFGTEPFDPVTFISVPALLAATALAACYLPSRAAVRVNPAAALRAD